MQTTTHTPAEGNALPAETIHPEMQKQLEDAEALTNDLKRLLVNSENILHEEGLRKEVETLERWMESYRRGLAAAYKISESGPAWLTELHDRLKLAADEIQRLEGEGGNPASTEQAQKVEQLLETLRHIEKVIPDIEHVFTPEAALENA